MDKSIQITRAGQFHAMHDRRHVLLLPNAWDAGSARAFADLGCAAIATTSGGVAWSLGYGDGEATPFDEVVAATRRIAHAVAVPVTADIEGGYGDTPDAVGASVRAMIAAGVVGINLEDGVGHVALRDLDEATARVAAARSAARATGVPIVINARVDVWMTGFGTDEPTRVAEALRRARAYLAAGADCIYPIALADPASIGTLVAALDAPVNVGARTGLPDLAELARLGVARVSTATRLATLAMSAARDALRSVLDSGRFDALDSAFGYADMQRLFTDS
ncbi:isocitrate lyase/PEP mutase family protein [Dokdonella sp.]|uniref:isocitrate lyase/PEP mutase family protein n=1 Tax=Dokdonella sp. TaxID=2291710 RepID=UPI0031C72B53|nr:isocitrate lyase/phosphoenolpyruvate mutase family protein [Dokdonella sp.]